jgi:hypothetical protein
MANFPDPKYKVGERVYSHKHADEVTITSIELTPQKQLRYAYKTDSEATGVATDSDLGDPPSGQDDIPDLLYINMCSIADVIAVFPNLPGGKGVLARKIIKTAKESPFDNEINFINRMLEIEPKVEWEAISSRLKFDTPTNIGV